MTRLTSLVAVGLVAGVGCSSSSPAPLLDAGTAPPDGPAVVADAPASAPDLAAISCSAPPRTAACPTSTAPFTPACHMPAQPCDCPVPADDACVKAYPATMQPAARWVPGPFASKTWAGAWV